MFNYIKKDKDGYAKVNIGKIILHSVLAIILLILFFSSFTIVGAGERGVVLNWGAFNGQIMQPGFNFKVPFMQKVVKMSVRTEKIEEEKSEAYSQNLQVVDIHSVINFNLNPQSVGEIYQKYGLDYEIKILKPNLEASVKQTVAKYTAEELLAKRAEVQGQIQEALKESVPQEFVITKYALVDEAFSKKYENAIEAKQVAQQEAEKAQNELNKAKIDAESRIAQAKGEAEAIKIQAQAITQQGGKDYVSLKWIEKWNGNLPQTMLGDSTPLINIGK